MANTIRIGIIGCGQIAQHHIRTYKGIPEAQIVVFCDANLAAAEASVAHYGSGEVTNDFRKVLEREDIDAVDVCLHNNFHAPITNLALRAGKNVYCEKPMAGSYADAKSMLDTAISTGKKLHIQLATLYSDETRAALELIEAGECGSIYHSRSAGFRRRGRPYVDGYGTPSFVQRKNASGGALYDMGVYHISRILYLMGNPKVERVSGKTYQKVEIDVARKESSAYDVEELGLGLVRLEGDRSLDLIESWAANLDDFGSSFLLGDKGGIKLSPFGFFKNVGSLELKSTADMGAAHSRWDAVKGDGKFYKESQAHWIAALQGECPLIPTAEIALNTMLVSEGIYLSQLLGREVTAEEVQSLSKSQAIAV